MTALGSAPDTNRRDARIGTTRFVDLEVIPILYPGECASSLSWEHTEDGRIVVTRWVVEPLPGLRGRWLRLRWRLGSRR